MSDQKSLWWPYGGYKDCVKYESVKSFKKEKSRVKAVRLEEMFIGKRFLLSTMCEDCVQPQSELENQTG